MSCPSQLSSRPSRTRSCTDPGVPGAEGRGQANEPQGCSTMQIKGLQHRLSGFRGPWNLSLVGHLSAPSSLHLPEPLECHQSQALLPRDCPLGHASPTRMCQQMGRGESTADILRNQGWEPKQTDKGNATSRKNLSQKKSSYSSSWERPLSVT